jgi:hypothetical protein
MSIASFRKEQNDLTKSVGKLDFDKYAVGAETGGSQHQCAPQHNDDPER